MSAGLPAGFREGHAGDLACPHRDMTVCNMCQLEHPEIISIGGQGFWMPDPAERRDLAAMENRRIQRDCIDRVEVPRQQLGLFKGNA
jgi:hypothetical protein